MPAPFPPSTSRRRARVGTVLLVPLMLSALAIAPACSGEDESGTLAADRTSTTSAGGSADATASDGSPSTSGGGDTTDPSSDSSPSTVDGGPAPTERDPDATTTSLLPAQVGVPDQPSTNSQGVPIVLDETALLACAQNQIAWVALQRDADAEATDALTIAALRAEASAVGEISGFATRLRSAAGGSDRQSVVDEFLALCVSRGFEY